MSIRCDICGEEVNQIRTFSFILTGTIGGSMSVGMWSNNLLNLLLGALFGLGVSLYILYTFNPLHWRHTRVVGKLLNIVAVKKH